MRRNALGIIAVFLIVIGAITTVSGPQGSAAVTFAGNCIRAGVVLGALWLALPQIQATITKAPSWLLSWFVGKPKPPEKADGASPPPRQRRPRRRSST